MKRCLALVFSGLLFLSSFALAENYDWSTYYKSVDDYPPIVFDSTIYEGVSGPPGGAMIRIEGEVWGREVFANHLGLYLKTASGEKWALNWLDIDDNHQLEGEKIVAYGAYTGIAAVHTQDPNYGYMPSMCVVRYVLNGETVNPRIVDAPTFVDDNLLEESIGIYRYEQFEGKTLNEVKNLFGGIMLNYENK